MSSLIYYPSKKDFEGLLKAIKNNPNSSFLKKYLPNVDSTWIERVIQKIELVQFDYYPKDLYYQSAVLFYKINKAHSEIDSNKRSAILTTYFFLLLNNKVLLEPNKVRAMAKRIAKSKGRKNEDVWIKKIKIFLQLNTVDLI